MKLKVLAGAKQGTEIPLKKSKFVIGRASDCTLRAGSDAISRHHCVLLRRDEGVSVRDLGSRNGTYVNDAVISSETPLNNGDKVRVGPLEFLFEGPVHLAHDKKPKVKDVAGAVERAAEIGDSGSVEEDDISRWLLGPNLPSRAMNETQSFSADDTRAMMGKLAEEEETLDDGGAETNEAGEADADGEADDLQADEDGDKAAEKGKKSKPGKLPKLPPKQQAKDSREAAADILRELARRR